MMTSTAAAYPAHGVLMRATARVHQQRLLVTAVMVAAKFLEDIVHSNSAW